MALTNSQRIAFFKLARRAYDTQQPIQDFNAWRKSEMIEAGLPDSVQKCSKIIGFDTLMLHFAELAYDMERVEHFRANEYRFLHFLISGLIKDLEWLYLHISGGRQEFEFEQDFDDAPVESLRTMMQHMGVHISDLCRGHQINTGLLPTATKPYYLRGKRAAEFADYINLKTGTEKRKEARKNNNQ